MVLNGKFTLVGLVDKGSSGCLLQAPAAARCGIEIVPDATALYGFANGIVHATESIGRCTAGLRLDGVLAKDIPILVVPHEAQSVDLLVVRTFHELLYIPYARGGGCLRFWHCSDCPFAHLEPYEKNQKLQLTAKEDSVLRSASATVHAAIFYYLLIMVQRNATSTFERCLFLSVPSEECSMKGNSW